MGLSNIKFSPGDAGCFLDNHRGHYISRDVIEFAVGYGFIIGPFEQWALVSYERDSHYEEFPNEGIIELADSAIEWLNSGQDECWECCSGSHSDDWPGPGYVWQNSTNSHGVTIAGAWVICKECSGSGRGSRIKGQNFPPRVPEDYAWGFNDGDFGLYRFEEES